MVVLKEFELSVNISFIYFQAKAKNVNVWLALTKTKSYFKNNNFEVYAEKNQQRTVYSV